MDHLMQDIGSRVAVLLVIYNGGKYLDELIRSCFPFVKRQFLQDDCRYVFAGNVATQTVLSND
jgi:hypothetical protein